MPEMTLADIETQYDVAMEKAKNKPDVLAQLQIEKTAAITEAKLRDVAARELALFKREALLTYPLAKEFQEHVAGDTEEAITASAKALHERLERLIETGSRDLEVRRLVEQHLNNSNQPPGEAGNDAEPAA